MEKGKQKKVEHGKERFKCFKVGCNKWYSSMSSRTNHMKKCEKGIKSPHKKAKKSEVGGYFCRYCKKKFMFQSGVYRHQNSCNYARILQGKPAIMKSKKKNIEDLVCNVCYKKVERKIKLEIHKLTHDNFSYCNVCSKKFKRRDYFESHQIMCSKKSTSASSVKGNDLSDVEFPPFLPIPSSFSSVEFPSFVAISSSFGNTQIDVESSQPSPLPNANISFSCYTDQETDPNESNSMDLDRGSHSLDFGYDFEISNQFIGSTGLEHCLRSPPSDLVLEDDVVVVEQVEVAAVKSEDNDGVVKDGDDYEMELCKGVLSHLIEMKSDSNYIFSMLHSFFGNRLLSDAGLCSWLHNSLEMRKARFKQRLFQWFSPSFGNQRGQTSTLPHQEMFDLWIKYSTISVDRRDGRDIAKAPKKSCDIQCGGIHTSLVTFATNKRMTEVAQVPRHVSCISVRKMKEIMEKEFNTNISYGSVLKTRTFFVTVASEREKLECLCGVCLNIRILFNSLMKSVGSNKMEKFTSLTK